MTVRIAHISDLHFGEGFDFGIWTAVKAFIVGLKPAVIVVSGDLVDSPTALNILAAKVELASLARDAEAELEVVPGNHDVYWSGLGRFLPRRDTYYRVFDADTSEVETEVARILKGPLGFTEEVLKGLPRTTVRDRVKAFVENSRPSWKLLPLARKQPLVRVSPSTGILFARLDSNSVRGTIGLATGSVAAADLTALQTALNPSPADHGLRVAIIHHHVLPIARTGGQVVGNESFMVCENAGTVLSVLADCRFDLILHGHKHRQQFSRFDFAWDGDRGYPIAVASAGSAAARSAEDRANCLNVIEVEPNGRFAVRCHFYGGTSIPGVIRPTLVQTYTEPLSSVKRRAAARAAQSHGLACSDRRVDFEVAEFGHVTVTDQTSGLRCVRPGETISHRIHPVMVSQGGWLLNEGVTLTPKARSDGYAVDSGMSTLSVNVRFPEPLTGENTASYGLQYTCGNSVNMTRWEAEERRALESSPTRGSGADWDEEWVRVRTIFPTQRLEISLRLPTSLREVQPYLRCTYNPRTAGTDQAEAEQTGGEPHGSDDVNMRREEEHRLRYDLAESKWYILIEEPILNYFYELRWRAAGTDPDATLLAEVLQQRSNLMNWYARQLTRPQRETDADLVGFMNQLGPALEVLLGTGGSHESYSVELYGYQSSSASLVGLCTWRSWSPERHGPSAPIAIGTGLAGAAFQQRRSIAWSSVLPTSHFAAPRNEAVKQSDFPGEVKSALALPLYHQSCCKDACPPPWSALGVLMFHSTAHAPTIMGGQGQSPVTEALNRIYSALGLAHAFMEKIVASLH